MKASTLLSSYLDSSDEEELSMNTCMGKKATKSPRKSQSFLASILMDSSDEEGLTPLKNNTSIPNKNAINEKKISTPTKEVRFDSSMLNLSGISSIAGGDSIVAPDPNRSKVTMPKKVRETINSKILQHEKVIKRINKCDGSGGRKKVVRSNGSPEDKKGDLALRT